MFGNNKNQNTPAHCVWIGTNNFCGGFALNAILNDSPEGEEGKVGTPMETYVSIQKCQVDLSKRPASMVMVINTLVSGSAICLPSSICKASEFAAIYVSYTNALRVSFGSVFDEEMGVIGEICTCQEIQNIEEFMRKMSSYKYHIVLVNGMHWVAIKKGELEGNFTCYDPGKGSSFEGETIKKAINNNGYEDEKISGLFITLLLRQE